MNLWHLLRNVFTAASQHLLTPSCVGCCSRYPFFDKTPYRGNPGTYLCHLSGQTRSPGCGLTGFVDTCFRRQSFTVNSSASYKLMIPAHSATKTVCARE